MYKTITLNVAPLAGAWIEMAAAKSRAPQGSAVAPLAGAWIEIHGHDVGGPRITPSHPSRVRGLKYKTKEDIDPKQAVAPLAGAWIEIFNLFSPSTVRACRTPRGCVD